MPAIYEHHLEVLEEHIDEAGHANNLAFLQWALDAALAHSAAQEWSAERYQARGVGWFVRSHQIRYHRPAFAGDQVVVRTWVANFKRLRSLRRFEVLRKPGNEILASGSTDWVFVDLETGNPQPTLPEVRDAYIVVPD